MGPIQTFDDLRRWLIRRWALIGLVTLLIATLGILHALNTDRVYRASAVIQVQNLGLDSGAPGAGSRTGSTATQRVQAIEQRMMARDNLLAMGEAFGLFDGTALNPTERLALMRESVRIEAVAAPPAGFTRDGSLSALIVSAAASRPDVAAAMANRMAEDLVTENIALRRARVDAALQFYQSEEARVEDQITALEAEIAAFQSRNEDVMPNALALRRDELARLSDSRLELQREVTEARGELAGLDVGGRGVTQRRVVQLNELLSRRSAEIMILNDRIAEIQSLFQRASELELEVNAMSRRMAQLQGQLSSVVDRRREAEISVRMEGDAQTERFELLEPALPPDYAVSRSRKTTVALAIAAGLLAGLTLAYLVEWFRPVLRTAAVFEREVQIRPVISLPYQLPAQEQRRRRTIWALGLGFLALALAALAMAAGLV